MSNVKWIADLHLGHKNIATHRGFQDEFYHDEHIIEQWNMSTNKRDTVFILGDVTMEISRNYDILDRLNGRKIVVLGNHDLRQHVPKLLKHVDQVLGCMKYKGYLVTHVPIHPMEFEYRVKGNIHGHIHKKRVMKEQIVDTSTGSIIDNVIDERYICVSCEHTNYKPINLNL